MKPNTEKYLKNEIEVIVNLYKQNKLNEALNLSNELVIKNNNVVDYNGPRDANSIKNFVENEANN